MPSAPTPATRWSRNTSPRRSPCSGNPTRRRPATGTLWRVLRNPEFVGALARLVAQSDPAAAAALDAEAWELFEKRRALYPEAALGHFVEHLLARGGTPGPDLVRLAEENYRLRPNPGAKLLLARACLETGEVVGRGR